MKFVRHKHFYWLYVYGSLTILAACVAGLIVYVMFNPLYIGKVETIATLAFLSTLAVVTIIWLFKIFSTKFTKLHYERSREREAFIFTIFYLLPVFTAIVIVPSFLVNINAFGIASAQVKFRFFIVAFFASQCFFYYCLSHVILLLSIKSELKFNFSKNIITVKTSILNQLIKEKKPFPTNVKYNLVLIEPVSRKILSNQTQFKKQQRSISFKIRSFLYRSSKFHLCIVHPIQEKLDRLTFFPLSLKELSPLLKVLKEQGYRFNMKFSKFQIKELLRQEKKSSFFETYLQTSRF